MNHREKQIAELKAELNLSIPKNRRRDVLRMLAYAKHLLNMEARMVAAHKLGIAHQEAGKAFNIASHNFATLGEVEAYEAGYLGAVKRMDANRKRPALKREG